MSCKKPHEELTIGYLVFQLVAFSLFIAVPVGGGLYFFLINYAAISKEYSDAVERLSLSEDGIGLLIAFFGVVLIWICLLYTSPSPRDATLSRMPSSA